MCDKIHRNNESTFCANGESTFSGQLESDMKVKVEMYFHTRERLELSCSAEIKGQWLHFFDNGECRN